MSQARRPLVAGNWKMNGLRASAAELAKMIEGARKIENADLLVCPPATLLMAFATQARGSKVAIGAQDCQEKEKAGSFTGDISAEMLADAGATAVIVGHSERRTIHRETDLQVRSKAQSLWRAGLTAIVCIGETREDRALKRTLDVVGAQLEFSVPYGAPEAQTVIAYEPVWAIGTGLTPTADDVAEVHDFIRKKLRARPGAAGTATDGIRLLYGGSVNPSNARELMAVADVDGALVGGASLKAEDFLGIAAAYR